MNAKAISDAERSIIELWNAKDDIADDYHRAVEEFQEKSAYRRDAMLTANSTGVKIALEKIRATTSQYEEAKREYRALQKEYLDILFKLRIANKRLIKARREHETT